MKDTILAIAGLVIVIGIFCLVASCFLFVQFRQWTKTRLLDIEVDISQPGEFSGQFVPKCPIAAYYTLLLELPPSFTEDSDTQALLDGLEARLSVLDSHGSELRGFKERDIKYKTRGNPIMLEQLYRLPEESYTLRFTIAQGAKALSGTKQHLFLEYRLGFQTIELHISLLATVVALTIGAGLTFYGLTLTKKKQAEI